ATFALPGQVAEWFKAPRWKRGVRATVPRVRIPPCPLSHPRGVRMRPAPRRLAALALLAGLPACAGGQASCPVPIAIDPTALMRDLYRLADDSLAGRLIGSPGNLQARYYLAARFDAIGLGTLPFGRLQRVSVTPSPRLPGVT